MIFLVDAVERFHSYVSPAARDRIRIVPSKPRFWLLVTAVVVSLLWLPRMIERRRA